MLAASMLPLRMMGLLLLMFSLCDADSRCSDEISLDPSEVVGEYGEVVSVNCTSMLEIPEDHYGMRWIVGNTTSPEDIENSSIERNVSLSDWDITVKCIIRPNETHECSKSIDITVYKNTEMVTLFPIKYGAVEGTPYELQCDVTDVAPVQNLTVRWYRGNETIRTDSFSNTTRTLVSESSTLTVNISRAEHGVQYRCEAQLDFGPHGSIPPVSSNNHTVSVHYAPELENKTEDVHAYEGDTVTLTCEAEGNPAPTFHWTHDGVKLKENTNKLNITCEASATYECTATNYLGNATKQIHVDVMRTARAPVAITTPAPSTQRSCPIVLTPAEIVVRFGDPASINCSTSAPDVFAMGWEATVGSTRQESTSVITWEVENLEDWAIKPLCYINTKDNFQCYEMANVILYKTPDKVSVSELKQGPMQEGRAAQLNCNITHVAPVQKLKVTWYRDNETFHTQNLNDTTKTPTNILTTLVFTPERDDNGALYRCEAQLQLGTKDQPDLIPTVTSPPYMADVHYKPLVKACPDHQTAVEHMFILDTLSCEADGNPAPTVQWYYEGKPINASEPLTRKQSGEYTAKIENILSTSTSSVHVTVEYGPSFSCGASYEVMEDGTLQCEPDGVPKPLLTWFNGGTQMASPQRWTKHNSGFYTLNATNRHGEATHSLYVDVLYVPEFKGTYNKEVNVHPGDNVTFDCTAEGNPSPEVHWNYTSALNVTETTRGSQKSIIGATSTNAGYYICVAANKVGSVRRTFTLIITERPAALHVRLTFLWVILSVVLLILVLAFFIHRWKRHGRYSFVPGNPTDDSMPMAPQANGASGSHVTC